MKPPKINTGKIHSQLSNALIKWHPEALNKHDRCLIREQPKHFISQLCQTVNEGCADRRMTVHRCDTARVPTLKTISDPVVESGSCDWYLKKKNPTMQQSSGFDGRMCYGLAADAGLQKNVSVACHCLSDRQAVSCVVRGMSIAPRPTSFMPPSVYCSKWQPDRMRLELSDPCVV